MEAAGLAANSDGRLVANSDVRLVANSDGRQHAYIPEIDGLRAIAVLAVVLNHLRPALLPGGFVGVDVFFVISGYVVTASVARDADRSFASMLCHFYARRMVRILPALLVCLFVSALFVVWFIPPSWLGNGIPATAKAAFVATSNMTLRTVDTYFSPRAEFNPFTHTWSLAVEEQFYLMVPPLWFAWHRLRRRKGAAGVIARSLLPVAAAGSVAVCAGASWSQPEAAFYLVPSRFWELAAGALLFQWDVRERRWFLPCGLGAIGVAMLFAAPDHFPLPWALLPVGGTCLVIVAVVRQRVRALSGRAMIWVGRRSYSLYLWHWPVFTLLRWTWGLETAAQQSAGLLLSFGLAAWSFRLVEQPVRRSAWVRRAPKAGVVVAGLAAVLVARLGAGAMFEHRDALTLSQVRTHGKIWLPEAGAGADAAGSCPVRTSYTKNGGMTRADLHRACAATEGAGYRVFVLGDSHALAYTAMGAGLAQSVGIDVQIISVGCPLANLLWPTAPDCAARASAARAEIAARARPGDVLLLAALRMQRRADQLGPVAPAPIDAATGRAALEDAARLIGSFAAVPGLQVVLEAPKPVFRAPVFRCVDWFNAANRACRGGLAESRAEELGWRADAMARIAALEATFPALVVWDPFDVLCPGATCAAMTPDGPLSVDGDHLSALANRMLLPSFEALLRRLHPDAR